MRLKPFVGALLAVLAVSAQDAALPGTQPLEWQDDLSARMVAGIDRFLSHRTELSRTERSRFWHRGFSSAEAYLKSIEKNRARLRTIVGADEPRAPVDALELAASTENAGPVAETELYTIRAIAWPVFQDVSGAGLWLTPKNPNGAAVIAVPDADQTPEMLCGLAMGTPRDAQFARRLAEAGFEVFVPMLISRSDTFSGNAELNRFTNQPHREWIYRQAYELGGHIIGYEVQKLFALIDWLEKRGAKKIAVAGWGEGGLIAFYSAALDPRVDAALVSGYFGPREKLWSEPIYRNVFGLLAEFGDAEVASLIAPRGLIVEHSGAPAIAGPPAPRPGRSGAAPGAIATPEGSSVGQELNRARAFFPESFETRFELVTASDDATVLPGADASLRHLATMLEVPLVLRPNAPAPADSRRGFDPLRREQLQLAELVNHTQANLMRSERVRTARFWNKAGPPTPEQWTANQKPFQRELWEEVLGKIPGPDRPPQPRARLILDEPKWRGYDVVLDVEEDVFAWGILLVPKDLKPGEKRPVVVCQHGLEGVPRDTIDGPGSSGYGPYKSFTARLADRGFIAFAPHNPYRGHDKFRVLQRKANPLGKSLFSVILAQHEQILNWLETLPFADPARIGFYGLSYGGKTAMRVPSLLNRYALSICSADFNEWVKKNATVDSPYSYMFSNEYEMPEFDLGRTYNYAEMAALIAPRPFMVERGHEDGVAPDEWVAYEFAKVKRFYDRLGIGDRAELEVFNGPHTIHGVGTFDFLHRHLRWPKPAE